MKNFDRVLATKYINQFWGSVVIPALSEFIRIPSKSPMFDEHWEDNGNLAATASFLDQWVHAQNLPGLESEILQLKGRSPFLFIDIPGQSRETVLFYAHMDKMPEAEGWNKGFGPWKPVVRNNRIYGRGSVDDGYALFSMIASIKLLQKLKVSYPRCVFIIEACEESGSYDLPIYLKRLRKRIGTPSLITCLDVGAGDYERMWCTNSLRGIVEGTLQVSVLEDPVHSGIASGIVPSSFRILRKLLDRIENSKTGEVLLKSCHVKIPADCREDAKRMAKFFGKDVYNKLPLLKDVKPVSAKLDELLLNSTWRPALSIIGAEGLPRIKDAGSVVRPSTAVQLSLRIPPHCKSEAVIRELKHKLETNPPYGAQVSFTPFGPMEGWSTPTMAPWLRDAIKTASNAYFGKPPLFHGEGGSIGVIPLLQHEFPQAQFVLTGVAGPNCNEHGPNESLYIPAAKKLTCCMAEILAEFAVCASADVNK